MQAERRDARWGEAVALTAALWLFVLLIFLPLILARHKGGDWSDVALDAGTIIVSFGLGLLLFALFRSVVERRPRLRALALVPAVAAAAIVNAAFDLVYTAWVAQHLESGWESLPSNLGRGYGAAFNYLLVFSVNVLLFQLSLSRRRALRIERQLAEARSSAQEAQLTALRYQLNPHFLFNALNSISALIVTYRNKDAEQMTDRLSSFLRASLACDPSALVPLGDEITLAEEYLDIEAVRFQGRLDVEISYAPEAGEVPVPGFLIQPLVENAVKHGVARSRTLVTIAVHAQVEGDEVHVTVENDVPAEREEQQPGGLGIGLANVQARLKSVYGDAASLTVATRPGSYCVSIALPRHPPAS